MLRVPLPLGEHAGPCCTPLRTLCLPCSGRGLGSVPCCTSRGYTCPVILPLAVGVSLGTAATPIKPCSAPSSLVETDRQNAAAAQCQGAEHQAAPSRQGGPCRRECQPRQGESQTREGGAAPVGQMAPHLLTASIVGGECSGQEVAILAPGWAQEEVSVWGHHQCECCCGVGALVPPMAVGLAIPSGSRRRGLPAGHTSLPHAPF